MTTDLSIDFSRATASAICSNSSLLAATPMAISISPVRLRIIPDGWFDAPRVSGFQTFPDQPIGQDQLGLGDTGQRQQHALPSVFSRRFHHDLAVVQSGDDALEAPPAIDRLFQFDPGFMPRKTFKVAGCGQ